MVTTRDVCKHEELLIDYSIEFWNNMAHNNRWCNDIYHGIECHDLTSE